MPLSTLSFALCVLFGLEALAVVLDPGRTRLFASGFYDLSNLVDHKLRSLLIYVMAAVRVRNVPGPRHLANELGPGLKNRLKQFPGERIRYVGRELSGLDERRNVIWLVRGEHDKGHRLQSIGGQCLSEVF